MKQLILSLGFLALLSCGSKTVNLESHDTQSKTVIRVLGEKESSLDPFRVNITVEANGLKEHVATEIYAGTIDSTNLKFDWREPGVCLMTFTQQDNTTRKILAVALEDKIGLKEME